MHTCLAYAAVLKAEQVINVLLEAASHDPQHKEITRILSKSATSLVFYEPVRHGSELISRVGLSHAFCYWQRRACSPQCSFD
jgi:hypothetical protein